MAASSEKESVIVTDPDILRGAYPVFRGTRVPFQNLLGHLAQSGSIDDFLIGFPSITREQVLAVLEYAGKSVRLRQAF